MRDVERVAYSPGEAMNALGVSRDWLYRQLNAGTIKSTKIAGRRFIAATELDRLLNGTEAS